MVIEWAEKIKKILNARRWCGITNRKDTSYDIKEIGWNYYLNEFSAVIGLSQLKKLEAKAYGSQSTYDKEAFVANDPRFNVDSLIPDDFKQK